MPYDQDRIDNVRRLFQRAADECQKQTGISVEVKVAEPKTQTTEYFPSPQESFKPVHDAFVDYDAAERQPRFNIGDIVIFNSGGTAMNVSNVNNYYPVVECVWTDEIGHYYCEIVPESCLRLYQEGSN